MFSEGKLSEQLFKEGYEKRPYGFRKKVGEKRQYLVIEPEKHTGLGADPKTLNRLGLRGHPGTDWEHVTHLGYVDGGDNSQEFSLLYIFMKDKRLCVRAYREDDMFCSVSDNGSEGYWHLLLNKSDRPIKLFIEWEEA